MPELFFVLAGFSPQSTRLGDEYIKRHFPNSTEEVSCEWIDGLQSWSTVRQTRLCGGAGYRVSERPEHYAPWRLRDGLEARPLQGWLRGSHRPWLALDLLSRQQQHWNADPTAQAGVELSARDGAASRLLWPAEYFDGFVCDGAFYRDHT